MDFPKAVIFISEGQIKHILVPAEWAFESGVQNLTGLFSAGSVVRLASDLCPPQIVYMDQKV